MARAKKMIDKIQELMYKPEKIRNMGIVAHIDHGKTTLSDNLLAGAGMISEELAGRQLYLDFDEQEQERGITINAANVSMVHNYKGEEYLINLIDTPGHVDFGGDVTRAMRAVDGAIVVVDAVEGVMPQTETVLRQALRENVKPVLFVNKVDRLIKELELSPEEMQKRLIDVINEVNKLIKAMKPERYDEWRLDVTKGSVAFGSALYKWAVSVPAMKETGIGFKEVTEYIKEGKVNELSKKSPLHTVVLDMVVRHLPNPLQAQKDRIKVIWKGDIESEEGKAMIKCDPKGPVALMITKIIADPHAGEIAVGRLFSGTIKSGMELFVVDRKAKNRIQNVGLFMGPKRVDVPEIPAGNIVAVVGLKDAVAGSTCTNKEGFIPFESIKHVSEPVVTMAIEAKNPRDLPKLIEVLRAIAKEDPTLQVTLNEETGEHLLSGMGELHLEVTVEKIRRDKNLEVVTSPPIVVFRETVTATSPTVEGKSPNKHNRFYIVVEPLPPEIIQAFKEGKVDMKMDKKERRRILEELGLTKEEAAGIQEYYEGNIFTDVTKGIQYLNETMELILEGFREAMRAGPLAREPVMGVKVKLVDCKLHEDAVHRGPAQVIPAVRSAIFAAILQAQPTLLEPYQKVFISVPQDMLGSVSREIQGRRGQIMEMKTEGDMVTVVAKAPVKEMFGFAGDIRSATAGKAIWSTELSGFEEVPQGMVESFVMEVRKRKGLKLEIPKPEDFLS
ncbi:translation elongation factor 2 (EF-2/EF-G) [Archaeoglobus sulfaticallidus PM70-1]|uniref:Elongation factor 2 n=1 Tax=Archaeoglobus sulfaticallidus PM70-1 TaxID=387631 RepID=N0BAS9_9EURY|nr:elongation factor EF-2 [Archaeoglobus sulfaticallidus]AGK60714.1 translation elongation factor 2 (EF-2/EF-G) [Archaeoglobus sulfaticallidus PM70-1]